jgi:hypothetical protein
MGYFAGTHSLRAFSAGTDLIRIFPNEIKYNGSIFSDHQADTCRVDRLYRTFQFVDFGFFGTD